MKQKHLWISCVLVVLLLCCILPTKAEAATIERQGTCGTNISYTLDSDGVMTFTGTGAMPDYTTTTWYSKDWEDEIKSVVIGSGITYVGNKTFYSCYNLTSVSLPSTVTALGEEVFSGCTDLTTVNIPSGVTAIPKFAFSTCRALTSISLPSSITSIGESAFSSAGLTSFTVSSKITQIGEGAFKNCYNLTKITVNSSNTVYASDYKGVLFNKNKTTLIAAPGALFGSYSIPSTVTSISPYAFYSLTDLTGITISSKVSDIGNYAFSNCSLTSVNIPGNVVSIGDYAFSSCALTSLTIQSGVTSIGGAAFYGCSNLATVTVPDTVTSIGGSAFANTAYWTNQPDGLVYVGSVLYAIKGTCPTSVTVKAGTVTIGSGVFAYQNGMTSVSLPAGLKSIGYRAFYECTGLTSVSIPSTVTELGEAAFAGCKNITSIQIPSGVTAIPNTLFSSCSNLASVSIPSGVTEIGTRAFWKCALTQVVLPSTLETIGDYAFAQTDLTAISIPNSVTTIGTQAFYYCPLTSVSVGTGLQTVGSQAFLQYSTTPSVYISDLAAWLQIDFDYGSNPMNGGPLYINGTQATSITVPSSVTQIKDYALQGCPSTVTRITLHSQITAIGNSAFRECSGITSVTIPSKVTTIGSYAFSYCTGLTSVTIPYGVTSIGSDAFYGCSGLTSVTVPDSVTSIGLWAFAECTSLESLKLSKNLTAIPGRLIARNYALTELTVPEGVTQIDAYAFGPSSLAAIMLPSTVTTIDTNAFYEVDSFSHVYYTGSQSQWDALSKPAALTDITVHYNVTGSSISKQVKCSLTSSCCTLCGESITAAPKETASHNFVSSVCTVCGVDQQFTYTADSYYGCIKITGYTGSASTLVIPDTIEGVPVRVIAENAFKNCTTLTDVTVPDSVDYIASGAFSGCTKLSRITLPFVGYSRASNYPLGYIFGTSYNSGCTYTKQVYRYSATSTSSAYYYIPKSLTSVTITDGSIKYGAFYNCTMLTSVILPEDITTISEYSFYYCSGLKELTIPEGVTSIKTYAFYYCSGLKELTIPEGVTSIGTYAFYYCSKLTHIVLPKTLISVGTYAFYCSKLKQVCYAGTEAQCSAISIGSSGNTYLTSAAWFYDAVDAVIEPHESCEDVKYICSYCERTVWTEAKTTFTHNYVDATCTTPKTCTICSATEGEALGHSGDLWFEIIASTCTDPGLLARICDVCGTTETKAGTVTDHIYETATKDPTCTEQGLITQTCTGCGDTIEETVAALGHTYETVTVDPTCIDTGLKTHICTVCGDVVEETVAALGHSFTKYVSNNDATSEQNGTKTGSCDRCGVTETVTDEGSQLVYVTGGTWGTNVTWSIYGRVLTISGTGVPDEAWSGSQYPWGDYCATITKIVVESGITEIPRYLFEYCESATVIILPETVTAISLHAFNDCGSLNNLLIPASVTSITGTSNTGLPAFIRCESLTDVYYLGTAEEWDAATAGKYVTSHDSTMTLHTLQRYEIKATCTEAGIKPYYQFEDTSVYAIMLDENRQLITQTEVAEPLGHSYVEEVVEPTCTTDGYAVKTCTTCGDTQEQSLAALGHSYETVVTEPTCTTEGYTTHTCTACADVVITDQVPARHSWSAWIQTVAPTCTAEGSHMRFCNCGARETEAVEKLPHSYTDGVCSVCGQKNIKIAITTVTLRPGSAGIYFGGSFDVDSGLDVKRQGIVLSLVNQLPVADGTDETCLWTQSGTSVLVANILSADKDDADNALNSTMPIYARAYVELADGTIVYSDVVGVNLLEVVQAIDTQWSSLTEVQQQAISTMYATFKKTMDMWYVPNLKEQLAV